MSRVVYSGARMPGEIQAIREAIKEATRDSDIFSNIILWLEANSDMIVERVKGKPWPLQGISVKTDINVGPCDSSDLIMEWKAKLERDLKFATTMDIKVHVFANGDVSLCFTGKHVL